MSCSLSSVRLFSAAVNLDMVTPESESCRFGGRRGWFESDSTSSLSMVSLGRAFASLTFFSSVLRPDPFSWTVVISSFFLRNMGLICTLVPAQPPFLTSTFLRALSFPRSSMPARVASSTALITLASAGSPIRSTSSWWPFNRSMKGAVWKVNLNFCFGVRSAWRITDTTPLSLQECLGGGGGGTLGVSSSS